MAVVISRLSHELESRIQNRKSQELLTGLDTQIEKMGATPTVRKIFHVGYLPYKPITTLKGLRRGFLMRAGLARWDNGISSARWIFPLAGRVIIPIYDVKGQAIALAGRRVGDNEESPKYINSPEHEWFRKSETLYGFDLALDAIRTRRRVFVVEGYSDVWMMHQRGYHETLATCGSVFTEYHAHLLKLLGVMVYLVFDGDQPGRKAYDMAYERCKTFSIHTADLRIELPENEDPASFLLKNEKLPGIDPIPS